MLFLGAATLAWSGVWESGYSREFCGFLLFDYQFGLSLSAKLEIMYFNPFILYMRRVEESEVQRDDLHSFFKKDFYLFIFRERGRKGEREGNINGSPLFAPQPGD